MEWSFNDMELRVLGALMEKQRATPEYYPLSLNALLQACNQKSSRNPVVNYVETEVNHCVQILYDRAFVNEVISQDRRVPRYDQRVTKLLHCTDAESAILCLLFLRGPQTPGELKSRSGRLHSFKSLQEVHHTLHQMEQREEIPLVRALPRQPGTKEPRFTHLLGSEPVETETVPTSGQLETPTSAPNELFEEVMKLRSELQKLREEFESFRDQF